MRTEGRARRRGIHARHVELRTRHVEPDAALANAIAIAHAAYRLCARKTRDENVAVAANCAASSLETILPSLRDGKPAVRLGERLRLEWLAAMGDADARLLGECARALGDAISRPGASDRIRLASAEAYSLARAVTPREASEAAWRSPTPSVAFLSFAR